MSRYLLKTTVCSGTYHKDSYMAHRRDWKTGFEGRYRRTVSPSSPNRNPLCTNTNERRNPVTSTTTSPSTTTTTTASTLRNFSTSQFVQSNNSKNLCDDKSINNGWPSSSQNSSTTVNFTTEELKAFKARRAHAQDTVIPAHPSQSSPTQSTLPPLTHQGSLSSASCNVGADSHFGSMQSGSPTSPSKLSPSQSWGTSLDSLNRSVSPAGTPITNSNKYSPRTITRATSLADPLHIADETGMTQEVFQLPRAASINESLSRISAINDSLSRSTSVADSLCRSISVTETPTTTHISHNFTHNRSSSVSDTSSHLSSLPEVLPASPALHTTPVPHDGPITAHPATVTEEASSPLSSKTKPVHSSSPKSTLTHSSSPKSSPVHSSSHNKSLESPPSPGSPSPANTSSSALSTSTPPPTTNSITPLAPSTSTHQATVPTTPLASSTATLLSASTTPPTSASIPKTSSTSSVVSNSPSYPVTSPSMSSPKTPVDNASIIVLGYGRTPYQEELDCDRLSQDYVPQFTMDTKLQALLAPGPEHKTAAHYMQGVFSLELRRDFISSTHANHPDVSQPPRTELPSTTLNSSKSDTANGLEMVCERAPIPADSAYFTTSESKAKMLTRLRGNNETLHDGITDQQQLYKKKEELVASIGRKLEILRAEREAIKEEMRLNQELGLEVTSKVEARARLAESEKYKLHVEEIDKITSLLLGLSGRLARAENALLMMVDDADPEEKSILERKRDKLSEQLEEAKRLKENIDRRAVQVAKVLNQYLTEDQYADYDHFIKMKAKLIMDAREIDDKIKLGEEQQQALRETMCKKQ
ncbi:hypothetical protein Pcinc_027696 [Petrolisthes cinctipes]|uniref:ASD2 domain-containing protein n=1 Tax=Petrolisthes cinctipes TaxID=88211 RepID=A0AAE1K9X4_PETCI|nr:hypothetical protein Pcinc_027696 [Petrolisthes cinctipes]